MSAKLHANRLIDSWKKWNFTVHYIMHRVAGSNRRHGSGGTMMRHKKVCGTFGHRSKRAKQRFDLMQTNSVVAYPTNQHIFNIIQVIQWRKQLKTHYFATDWKQSKPTCYNHRNNGTETSAVAEKPRDAPCSYHKKPPEVGQLSHHITNI